MKNYLKKLLVGLLVAAMTVTNIDYVPVAAKELAVGDDIIGDVAESTMTDADKWEYSYAWVATDADQHFSTEKCLKNYNEFNGNADAEASVITSSKANLKVGVYTIKFKGYADNVTAYPYVDGKVETSSSSVKGEWGNPGEVTLTFSISEAKTANIGIVLDADNADAWFNVGDISVTYTSTEMPVEKEYWIAGNSEAFGADWTEVKMTKEKDGTYSYELGYLELSTFKATVYYDETWGTVKYFENIPVAAAGYVKVFATVDEEDYDKSTIVAKVYTDDTYSKEVAVVDKDYYVAVGTFQPTLTAMTKENDGTCTYKLGKVEETTNEWVTVTEDTDWNVKYEFGTKAIPAGYVKLVFNTVSHTLEIKVYEDAEYTKEIIEKAYFVGFDGNLSEDTKMTEESEGIYSLKCGSVNKGTVQFGVYNSLDWNDVAVVGGCYIIYADGYGKVVYDSAAGTVTYEVYEDSDYKNLIEDTTEKPDFYFGTDGSIQPMTKLSDGMYSYEFGKVLNGAVLGNGVYGPTGRWNDVVINWSDYEIPATGFLKVYFDSVGKIASYKIYTDDTYTELVKIENPMATIYVYYPGDKDVANDTLTIAFAKAAIASSQDADKLGNAYKETYWNRTCFPLKKVAGKDNWYTFDVYKDFGGFQIVANPHSEVYPTNSNDNENTTWIIDFGYYGDVKTADTNNEKYNALFEKKVAYVMYNTLFDSVEEAEAFDKAFGWDYYIAGSTASFEPDCNKGIFSNYWAQDNYHFVEAENRYVGDANWLDQMEKSSDGKKLTWVSKEKAKKFETYALNVYADKSWFGKVWKNNYSFLAVADAYVKITYDLVNSKFTVEYFDDTECKEPTEFDEVAIYYFYGVTGSKDLYLAFNTEIPGMKATKTYWGRNCYPMTEVGNGWYVFKGYKAIYGGYQVVVNPQNEDYGKGDKADKEGTIWQTDIGDYGDISTSDADLSRFKAFLSAGNKAYIKYNKIFKTQEEADSFVDWTYYVAGSTTAYTNTDAGKGIFSNYWAGDFVKGVDDDGKAYEKKEDTWPDVLTKEGNDVYSIKLGKAVKGTTYAFNVYTEKDWNATNLTGSMGAANPQFKATSNNFVKLYFYRDLKSGKNTWAVEYYTDKECKNKAKLSAPTKVKAKSIKATKGAKVKLTWKAVDGATSYAIYANGKKVAGTTKTSKIVKYGKAGKTVKFTVVARSNEYGYSAASKAVKVKTPGIVSKVKAKGLKSGIKITWKKVKKSNGYVVYRSTKKKKGFKKVATLKSAKKHSFLDKKASKGKKYFYKVFAFRKNGKKVKVYSNASKLKSAKRK